MTGKGLERFRVLTAAALNIFVLYFPRPLLPLYANLYNISEPTAGLIMTATMLPLAVAPLSYGYVLNTIQTLKLLRASLLLAVLGTYIPGLVCGGYGWAEMVLLVFGMAGVGMLVVFFRGNTAKAAGQ